MSPSTVAQPLDFTVFTNTVNGKQKTTEVTRNGINPATKQPNPPVPVSTQKDLDEVVAAARAAFPSWRDTPAEERQRRVLAWGNELAKYEKEFIQLLTQEQGKPLPIAGVEFKGSINTIKHQSKYIISDEVVEETDERRVVVRYTPLGVAGGIVPWNFPLLLAVQKIVPALITGNTMIVKPSPFTPYCGLKIVELAQNFFPPGVLQAISGDDNLGPWLTSHPGINKISFTGSSFTGKKVMESCAKTLKRVTLELGGNDAAIIFPDVDIPTVAPQVAQSAFMNSGQICIAIKRIFIHSSIYDAFVAAMAEAVKSFKVGDGTKPGVFMGPVQNSMQYERVRDFFTDIKKQNQKVIVGGEFADSDGYFIKPTIIDRPAEDSMIVASEPFGPIVPALSFDTEDEAIERANKTDMGLGASVWSADLDRCERVAKRLEAGNVWTNEHLALSPSAPFGGHKASGVGVEGGRAGMYAYCNSQTLYLKKKTSKI